MFSFVFGCGENALESAGWFTHPRGECEVSKELYIEQDSRTRTCYSFAEWSNATEYVCTNTGKQADGRTDTTSERMRGGNRERRTGTGEETGGG